MTLDDPGYEAVMLARELDRMPDPTRDPCEGAHMEIEALHVKVAALEARLADAQDTLKCWDEEDAQVLDALRELTPELSGTPALERIAVIKARLADAEQRAERAEGRERGLLDEVARLTLAEQAHEDMGVYPAGNIDASGKRRDRTEREDGWNDYGRALLRKQMALDRWWKALPAEVREALLPLIRSTNNDAAVLRLSEREGAVKAWLLVSDTFAFACADGEDVPCDATTLAEVAGLNREYGYSGLAAWAAVRRGAEPIEPLRGEKYQRARAALATRQAGAAGGEVDGG
jgi:hypothetical protein